MVIATGRAGFARLGARARSQAAVLEAPAQAAAHPLFERHGRAITQLGLRFAHHARDGLVHLGQYVDLLLVGAQRLDAAIDELGDVARQARQAHALVGARLLELALEQTFDRVDDLADRIGPLIRDPVDLTRRAWLEGREQQALAQVVDVGHRTRIVAVAHDRSLAVADHAEEQGLVRRMPRTV